jgi:hypothetical protein
MSQWQVSTKPARKSRALLLRSNIWCWSKVSPFLREAISKKGTTRSKESIFPWPLRRRNGQRGSFRSSSICKRIVRRLIGGWCPRWWIFSGRKYRNRTEGMSPGQLRGILMWWWRRVDKLRDPTIVSGWVIAARVRLTRTLRSKAAVILLGSTCTVLVQNRSLLWAVDQCEPSLSKDQNSLTQYPYK